jgi:hypothetical protein
MTLQLFQIKKLAAVAVFQVFMVPRQSAERQSAK